MTKGYYVRYLKNFLFPRSWGRVFKTLSPSVAGALIVALFDYANGENDIEKRFKDENLRAIFTVMCEQLEESAERYCERAGFADYAKD